MKKRDIIENIDINEILNFANNDPLIINYLVRRNDIRKNRIQSCMAFNEISTYEGVLDVLSKSFNYRWNDETNILSLIGAINSLLRSNNAYLYASQQPIIIDEENENSICGYEGIEVLKGHATKEELAHFYQDLLRRAGFNVLLVESEMKSISEKQNPVRQLFIKKPKENTRILDSNSNTCNCEDYGIIFEFDGDYYFYDPTEMVLCSIENCMAMDIFGEYSYTIAPQSLILFENMNLSDARDLFTKVDSKNVRYNKSQLLDFIKDGINDIQKVDHDLCKLLYPLINISEINQKARILTKNI